MSSNTLEAYEHQNIINYINYNENATEKMTNPMECSEFIFLLLHNWNQFRRMSITEDAMTAHIYSFDMYNTVSIIIYSYRYFVHAYHTALPQIGWNSHAEGCLYMNVQCNTALTTCGHVWIFDSVALLLHPHICVLLHV